MNPEDAERIAQILGTIALELKRMNDLHERIFSPDYYPSTVQIKDLIGAIDTINTSR